MPRSLPILALLALVANSASAAQDYGYQVLEHKKLAPAPSSRAWKSSMASSTPAAAGMVSRACCASISPAAHSIVNKKWTRACGPRA